MKINFADWRRYATKKRVIWGAVILAGVLIISLIASGRGKGPGNIKTETVKRQDLKQTVLSTGQVVSDIDLNLSFQGTGVVRQVLVKEGAKVQAGQTLAVLDQGSAQASVTTAQGGLVQAQANYDKLVSGAADEDVQVSKAAVDAAQTTLTNAKQAYDQTVAQQKLLVANAYSTMLNSGLAAIPATTNSSNGTIAVSGVYNGTTQGKDTISIVGSGTSYNLTGLDTDYANIIRGVPIAIGSHGLYVTFSASGSFNVGDTWAISIPNTQSTTYLANYNAYQAALQTQSQSVTAAQSTINSAQSALEQAQATLALKQAHARPQDLEAARAQVLSAQGQLSAAQVVLNNTVLRAPAAGTVTKVDIKVGEQATALQPVMILQDVGDLHAEANVSEADIASVKVGQDVDYTFDALGPDRHSNGKVETVNPASTVVSGIVNYKVTASIDDVTDIKPGMTANMTVLVAEKSGVLAVSSNAVINQDNKKYVRVIDDPAKKTYHQVEVKTGLNADGGLVEILSGLDEGQEVVTDIQ